MDWIDLVQERNGNELLGSIKYREFLDKLRTD
jgi:hypothetical protein